MKLRDAILFVLEESPGTGMQIKDRIAKLNEHFWFVEGRFYPTLRRLEDEGRVFRIPPIVSGGRTAYALQCDACRRALATQHDESAHNTGDCGCDVSRALCWRAWNNDRCQQLSPYDPDYVDHEAIRRERLVQGDPQD